MPSAHLVSVRRLLSAGAAATVVAAVCVATASPAHADGGTTISISGPTTIIIGTRASINFTVSGSVSTADPTNTDVNWSLERDAGDCFLFNSGDTTPTGSGAFSDHDFVQPGDLSNDCAGEAVVDVDAIDNTSFGSDEEKHAVKILRAARWEAFNAHPEPIHKNGSLHIDGTLQRADWTDDAYHRYTQHSAELQFRTTTGSYATVKTVSSATGDFSAKETQSVSGCWRYVFPGSSTTGPATTAGDCVSIVK